MNLIALAKSIQSFIQKDATLEAIYKEVCSNKSLPFKDFVKPVDLIKIVFLAKKVSNREDPKEIMSELNNNLFLFSTVEFEDNNQELDCEKCLGDGKVTCTSCNRDGMEECNMCGGSGEDEYEDDCDYCHGWGRVECTNCNGTNTQKCSKCEGNGYYFTEDYVPYEIGYYVSYDETFKTTLEQKLLRNDTEEPILNSKKTFLLSIKFIEPKNGESENIKGIFANTTHLLDVNTEDVSENLIYENGKISPTGFYIDLDKFK
jgi:hypothetical protein